MKSRGRCQLHGEPIQDYHVHCPHGCAGFSAASKEIAHTLWNRRAKPDMPSVSDEMVERMCAAYWKSLCYQTDDWEDVDNETKEECRKGMRAAIQAMNEASS
jgi:hypothetical protein